MREWILPHDVVWESPDPDASLLEFLQSTYVAAAELRLGPRDARPVTTARGVARNF